MAWRAFGSNRAEDGVLEISVQSTMRITEDLGAVTISIGDANARYETGDILAIRTQRIERTLVPAWRIVLESREGPSDLITLGSESDALSVAEEIARLGHSRLIEHTGRIVERDEHGLTVLQQIARHPTRWPRPQRTPSMRGSVKVEDDSVVMDLPSEVQTSGFLITALLFASTLLAGPMFLLVAGQIVGYGRSTLVYGWAGTFLIVLVIIAFLNQSSRAFEGKHRVVIRRNEVTVSGRFLGLIPLPAESFPLDDFRDIDATQAWGLTLLFGSRRIRCDVPAIEGQCLIGEMIDALRSAGALPFFAINDEEE